MKVFPKIPVFFEGWLSLADIPEVRMGHPAPNKDKCERGVEEKSWRG